MTSFLLENAIVIPCEGDRTVIDPGSVLVVDGRIEAVDRTDLLATHPAAANVERIDLTDHHYSLFLESLLRELPPEALQPQPTVLSLRAGRLLRNRTPRVATVQTIRST